jgi:hypothetical protein
LVATLLRDGSVLVAGGFADDNTSAEVYSPKTGAWTATGHLTAGRGDEQTAVALADGRVLSSGGQPSGADLYDPATGTWTAAGAMKRSYSDLLVSVLLPDGRVFITGGGNAAGSEFATGQIYQPATDAWTVLSPMSQARYVRSATLLPDRTILVVGTTASAGGQAVAERYDPTAAP